jgi:serine phosphatase RsbU (regulator of sigma subunit)
MENWMSTTDTDTSAPKRLYRLVEPAYDDLSAIDETNFYKIALERTRERFGAECGIESVLLARLDGFSWKPIGGKDESLARALEGFALHEQRALRASRILFASSPFPLAAWLLGSRGGWLALFRLQSLPGEGAALLLQMARLAVQQRALEVGWTGILDRAREIQRSLLPDPLSSLSGFELDARSESADEVGGDVYDTIRLTPEIVGLMIADASGHGLPAALEARDVVVGLRMGASWQWKIEATIERLNRILCSSTLPSRFVSLIYGELDAGGAFSYINAGHPAPLLITADGYRPLPESDRVLGFSPNSDYTVRRAQIPPGGILLLYTDGVTECPSPAGEEFGIERLAGIVSMLRTYAASHITAAVFEALTEHAAALSLHDDASLLVVKRQDELVRGDVP